MVALSMTKTPEELAEKERPRAQKEAEKAERQAQREREAFLRTPVGQARTAFERGAHVFQYAHDVESQDAVIVSMVGSTSNRSSSDPAEILNGVAREGWELVTGSLVFREQGQQSGDKFMSSHQTAAIKGTGYFLFRRAAARTDDAAVAA